MDKEFKQVLGVGLGRGVGVGDSIYTVEISTGAKNIKGLFEYPSAFSSVGHLRPWSYQLYFSFEYA